MSSIKIGKTTILVELPEGDILDAVADAIQQHGSIEVLDNLFLKNPEVHEMADGTFMTVGEGWREYGTSSAYMGTLMKKADVTR